MIDIKFLRENPEVVRQNIRNKFQDAKLPLVDEVIELDRQSRAERERTKQIYQELQNLRNPGGRIINTSMDSGFAMIRDIMAHI